MHRTCIGVIDATRARLFTLDRHDEPEGLRETLIESADLVNPSRRHERHDRNHDARVEHLDEAFARVIVDQLAQTLRVSGCQRLVLCASPHMLGILRPLAVGLHKGALVIDEIPHDLVKLTAPQLRQHLAATGDLPAMPARAAS